MGLERQTDLYDAPAEKDQADRADKAKDESGRLLTAVSGSPAAKAGEASTRHGHAHDGHSILFECPISLFCDGLFFEIGILDVLHGFCSPPST